MSPDEQGRFRGITVPSTAKWPAATGVAAKKLKEDEAEEAIQRNVRESASGRDTRRTT